MVGLQLFKILGQSCEMADLAGEGDPLPPADHAGAEGDRPALVEHLPVQRDMESRHQWATCLLAVKCCFNQLNFI